MKFAARTLLLCAALAATLAYAQTTFQHIIVIVQENRTPDNLFQGLCVPAALCPTTYNISPNGVTPTGQPIRLTSDLLPDTVDPDHMNRSFVSMYNLGGINQGPFKVYCDTHS